MRIRLLAVIALLGACTEPRLEVSDAFNQTMEAGKPLVPQTGPEYQTGGVLGKALCLYSSGDYAHITHYWSYNTAMARDPDVKWGTYTRTSADSIVIFNGMRGRLSPTALDIENGTYFFVPESSRKYCPSRR